MLLCVLLTLVALSKPVAAQTNRQFSPGLLVFDAELGGATQEQAVVLNNYTSLDNLIATSGGCPWAGLPRGGISGKNLVVQVNPLRGTRGTNTCNILVTLNGAGIGTLPVTLNLGNGGLLVASNGIAAPVSLTFTASVGSNNPPAQTVTVNAPGDFNVAVTYPDELLAVLGDSQTSFLTASPDTAAGKVIVSVNNVGLGWDVYKGLVYIETSAGTQLVQVNFVIAPSGKPVTVSQPTISFKYQAGGPAPNTSFTVSSGDGTPIPLSVTSPANWITIANPDTQTTPASYSLTVNPAALPNGLNTAAIAVKSPGAANSLLIVPVSVLVSGSSVPGGGGASSLFFSAPANRAPAASQAVYISNWKVPSYVAKVNTGNGNSPWLKVSSAGSLSTTADPVLTVTADPAGLSAGTYKGSISLEALFIQQTIPVTLLVTPPIAAPIFTVTPNLLNFSCQPGGPAPAPQSYTIVGPAGSPPVPVAVAAQTQNGGDWLVAGAASGTVNSGSTLAATAIPGNLGPGTYQGSIVLKPNGAASVTLQVTLTVQPPLTVSVLPATLTFNYRMGDEVPASQTVQVGGTGGLAFTAEALSAANWLSVTPPAGTISANNSSVTAAVDPTNLSAGAYNGTVTVAGANGVTGPATVNVSLTVEPPLPTIAAVVNAASYVDGPIAAGEVLTIFGTHLGPATGLLLALDQSGNVATTLGGVQVLVGSYPAPLIYASSGQVSAVAPYEIGRPFLVSPTLVVKYLGQSSNAVQVTQAGAAPAIFTANSSGTGQGAILNSDYSANSTVNPAARGDIVLIFMTGEGQTTPAGVSGKITGVSATGPLTPQPVLRVSVAIDGQPASVQFSGEAPDLIAGVMQLNVQIPPNARSGDLPVAVTLGTGSNASGSQPGVTVSVR
jgi:trimeric autotransporter adhesin